MIFSALESIGRDRTFSVTFQNTHALYYAPPYNPPYAPRSVFLIGMVYKLSIYVRSIRSISCVPFPRMRFHTMDLIGSRFSNNVPSPVASDN